MFGKQKIPGISRIPGIFVGSGGEARSPDLTISWRHLSASSNNVPQACKFAEYWGGSGRRISTLFQRLSSFSLGKRWPAYPLQVRGEALPISTIRSEEVIHPQCDVIKLLIEQTGIDVKSYGRIGVAEHPLDGLYRCS